MGNGLDGGHGDGVGDGFRGGPEAASGDGSGRAAKAALRRSILSSRAASDPERRAADDARLAGCVVRWIASRMQPADGRPPVLTIAAHVPVDAEPGATSLAPDQLLGALADALAAISHPEGDSGPIPVRLLLPVCPPGPPAALHWAEYSAGTGGSAGLGTLAPGKYGLPEPVGPRLGPEAIAEADIIIVPGVAADRSGMRMGRGAGYYDRSLIHATGRVAAILHPGEIVAAVPHDAHDRPVDAVITADELIIAGA